MLGSSSSQLRPCSNHRYQSPLWSNTPACGVCQAHSARWQQGEKTIFKGESYIHSGKKKLNEPREYLFTGLRSKVLVVK